MKFSEYFEMFMESFDTPYKFRNTFSTEEVDAEDEETGEEYQKTVLSPGQIVRFEGSDGTPYLWYARQNRHDDSLWEITFGVRTGEGLQKGSHALDIELTNKGDAFRVLSTVLEITNSFLEFDEEYEVQTIWIGVNGNKRKALYLKHLLPRIDGMEVSDIRHQGGEEWHIEMVRTG